MQILRGEDPDRQSSARSPVERQCNKERSYIPESAAACTSFAAKIRIVSQVCGAPLKGNAIRKGLTFRRALRRANPSQVGEVKSTWTDDAGLNILLTGRGETPLDMVQIMDVGR